MSLTSASFGRLFLTMEGQEKHGSDADESAPSTTHAQNRCFSKCQENHDSDADESAPPQLTRNKRF